MAHNFCHSGSHHVCSWPIRNCYGSKGKKKEEEEDPPYRYTKKSFVKIGFLNLTQRFHSSAFSSSPKIGKAPIYFPKFGKCFFFQKLKNWQTHFLKLWNLILETLEYFLKQWLISPAKLFRNQDGPKTKIFLLQANV